MLFEMAPQTHIPLHNISRCVLWPNTSISSSFSPPDHQGPEVVDYRWRDAANRLMHPHLLADCGPT